MARKYDNFFQRAKQLKFLIFYSFTLSLVPRATSQETMSQRIDSDLHCVYQVMTASVKPFLDSSDSYYRFVSVQLLPNGLIYFIRFLSLLQ